LCLENREQHKNKRPLIGDWYVDCEAATPWKVLARPEDIESLSELAFWVPDLDDLFELLNNQIRFAGDDPAETDITLKSEAGEWRLEVVFPDGILTKVGPHDSPHETLWKSLYCLSSVANLRRSKGAAEPEEELTKEEIKNKCIEKLESTGTEILRFARERFAEMGRGYVTICIKNAEDLPWKEGLYYYNTEEENKRTEEDLPYLTENDKKLAIYLEEYDPETDAVVIVWHAADYYVNKISDGRAIDVNMALSK